LGVGFWATESRFPRPKTYHLRPSPETWTPAEINTPLTIRCYARVNISRMPSESLRIEDQPGAQPRQRILRLDGPLVMATIFEFQATVRADSFALADH